MYNQNSFLKQPRQALFWVLAIALTALLINLNGWSVLEASEARYAEISREMFRSGSWLHPTLLNIRHYHKPPVVFWLTSLGFQLFGVNAFGARFFLQLSVIVQGALIYGIAKRLFGVGAASSQEGEQALLAAIIYLSLPLSIIGSRNLTTDSFLTTLVLATVYSMSAYYCQQKRQQAGQRKVWGIYSSALCIGLGFLTKGPAIFVVPFFFWTYLMLARKEDYRVPIKHLLAALVLCLGIGLSWYVLVSRQVPGLANYFIGQQVVARVSDDQAFDRAQPFWYYPLILATTTLPWCWLYLWSWVCPRYRLYKNVAVKQLSFFWLLLPFIVFALSSSKLMMYLLPLYPGIALILSNILLEIPRLDLARLTKGFFIFYELIGCLLLFGGLITQSLGVEVVVTWPMIAWALMLMLMPPLVWQLISQPRLRIGTIAFFSTMVLTIYSTYFFQANELLIGGTRPLAQFIQSQGLQDRPVLVYNKLLPSLAFNLDRNVITINDTDANHSIQREYQFETNDRWRQYWLYSDQPAARASLAELARSPSTLITRGEVPERWNWLLGNYSNAQEIGRWTVHY